MCPNVPMVFMGRGESSLTSAKAFTGMKREGTTQEVLPAAPIRDAGDLITSAQGRATVQSKN